MTSIILKAGLATLTFSALIFLALGEIRKALAANKKNGVLYFFCTILLFPLAGLIAYGSLLSSGAAAKFILMQGLFVVLGTFHNWAMRKCFIWSMENSFGYKLLFSLAIAMLGGMSFLLVLDRFDNTGYSLVFTPVLVTFLIPFLIWETFISALNIPEKMFNVWVYPKNSLADPDINELTDLHIISLYFKKNINSSSLTHFKVKAPESMTFGVFFYHFINDYNARHTANPIEYSNKVHKGWLFYKKPGLWPTRKNIDFERSVVENNIRQGDIIICDRV